ncbi:MAG: DUF4202 domain-containing protein [Sulfuricellaceae bacterium]|nr:DUF4202 domain-containing protein [Sulfuricellaceae bacterium]
MISDLTRFNQAIAKFDAANAEDPNKEVIDGKEYPKELLYAQRMSDMLNRFAPDAPEHVQLAVRAQHICRWKVPRDGYPMTKAGYYQWRTYLYGFHGETAGAIMQELGYGQEIIDKLKALLKKEKLKLNPETQLLEDVIDLTFLEHYLEAFVTKYSSQYDEEKLLDILRKTWKKMSESGHEAALKLNYTPEMLAVVKKALGL